MEHKFKFTLDDSEIDALITEILRKFPYARRLGLNKAKVLDADNYLKMIEQYPDEKKLSAITHIRNTIIPRQYNMSFQIHTNDKNFTYSLSDIMWEYVYVLARLYHYGESMWEKHFFQRMKELVGGTVFQEEIQEADSRIEEYVRKRVEIINAMQEISDKKESEDITHSSYHIAEGRKTDVMKVINYMYDLKCFTQKDGQPLNRQKTQFMTAIGKFLGSDFSNYAQVINKAAQEDHYQDIFIDMCNMAKKKILL